MTKALDLHIGLGVGFGPTTRGSYTNPETPVFDPEDGLTLTDTIAAEATFAMVNTTPTAGQVRRNANAVFAIDFEGLDGSAGGRIIEAGGTGANGWCGFDASGNFLWRIGGTPGTNGGAYILIAPTTVNYPTGDGTLVLEAQIGTNNLVRAWWNGNLIDTGFAVDTLTQWGGSDTGGYYTEAAAGAGQPSGLPTGRIAAPTDISGLRYYHAQVVAEDVDFPDPEPEAVSFAADFTNASGLFQDTAGTTPVTATGQNVRRIDKGGLQATWVSGVATWETGGLAVSGGARWDLDAVRTVAGMVVACTPSVGDTSNNHGIIGSADEYVTVTDDLYRWRTPSSTETWTAPQATLAMQIASFEIDGTDALYWTNGVQIPNDAQPGKVPLTTISRLFHRSTTVSYEGTLAYLALSATPYSDVEREALQSAASVAASASWSLAGRTLFRPSGIPIITEIEGTDDASKPILINHHGLSGKSSGTPYDPTGFVTDHALQAFSPWFDERFSSDAYQKGGYASLEATLIAAFRTHLGQPAKPVLIYGHSAGGQWVSRVAAYAPVSNVQRYVVANPSTWVFPDDRDYPFGFGHLAAGTARDEAIAAYLALPLTVYIGELDTATNAEDPTVDGSAEAQAQGNNRHERATNCFAAAQAAALSLNVPLNWIFVEAAGVGHSGGDMLDATERDDAFFPPDVEEPVFHTYAVDSVPTITVTSGNPLSALVEGDILTATPATWTRDGVAYTPGDGELHAAWYLRDINGVTTEHSTNVQITLTSDEIDDVLQWREALTAPDSDVEEPVEAQTAATGPVSPATTQATAITETDITIPDSDWVPDNQQSTFRANININSNLSSLSGLQMQWTTDFQDPPREDKWETLTYSGTGDVWHMDILNPASDGFQYFNTSQTARHSLLRFRYRYSGFQWSTHTSTYTVPEPDPIIIDPPDTEAIWFKWMFQSDAAVADASKVGKTGIQVQFMLGMDMHPLDDTKILIGQDVSGVWRCLGRDTDGRLEWEHAPCRGMTARSCISITADPNDTTCNTWLVAVSDGQGGAAGLQRTTDYGDTFQTVLPRPGIPGGGGGGYGDVHRYHADVIKFAPSDSDIVYFIQSPYTAEGGSQGQMFRSTTGGVNDSFTAMSTGAKVSVMGRVFAMDVHPTTASTLIVAAENGLYRSVNSGADFTDISNNLPALPITSVEYDRSNAANIRVTSFSNGVWETSNGGASPPTWTRVLNFLAGRTDSARADWSRWIVQGLNSWPGSTPQGSRIKPPSGAVQTVQTDAFIYGWSGPDDFPNWHNQIRVNGTSLAKTKMMGAFRFSEQTPSKAIGHSRCVFWENRTGYNQFENASIGYDGIAFGETNINSLTWAANNPDIMAMGVFDYGVYFSSNGGRTWNRRGAGNLGLGSGAAGNYGIALHPAGTGGMICTAGFYNNASVACSRNNGQTWPNNLLGHAYRHCKFVGWNANNGNICYSDKQRSTNGGVDWVNYGSGFPGTATDGGKVIGVSPSNGNVVWAINAAGNKIFRSSTSGASFSEYFTLPFTWNMNTAPFEFNAFCPHPTDATKFFYFRNGLHEVGTGGATSRGLTQLTNADRVRVRLDNPEILYVLRRVNGGPMIWANDLSDGKGWRDFTDNMVSLASVRTIEVLPSGDLMYGGTCGTGIRFGLGDTSTSLLLPGRKYYDIVRPTPGSTPPSGSGAPTITSAGTPVASGSAVVGTQLSVPDATVSGTVTSTTYQWKLGGTPITGATQHNYVPALGETGAFTREMTVTNASGSATATSAAITVADFEYQVKWDTHYKHASVNLPTPTRAITATSGLFQARTDTWWGVNSPKFYTEFKFPGGNLVNAFATIGITQFFTTFTAGIGTTAANAEMTLAKLNGGATSDARFGDTELTAWDRSAGSTVRVAVDPANRKCWFGNPAGWDGDPEAGTGGFNIPDYERLCFHCTPRSQGSGTGYFEILSRASDFDFAAPSGFVPYSKVVSTLQRATPKAADDMVEMVGINLQLNRQSTDWGLDVWRNDFHALGIRYIRTLPAAGGGITDLNELISHATNPVRGVLARLVAGDTGVYNHTQATQYFDAIANNVDPTKVLGFEGPNEPNKAGNDPNWAANSVAAQKHVFDAVNANGTFASKPVLSIAFWNRSSQAQTDFETAAALVSTSMAAISDATNGHYYTDGSRPCQGNTLEKNHLHMNRVITQWRDITDDDALWVTEYGHHTYDIGTDSPANFTPTPSVAANYFLRGLVEWHNRGAAKVFIYTLFDDYDTSQDEYGLIRRDAAWPAYTGEKRPAYDAVRRFLDIYRDASPATLTDAKAVLTGNLSNIKVAWHRKSNGKYLLTIFNDEQTWDRDAQSEVAFPDRTIRLGLPVGRAAEIRRYLPTYSSGSTSVGTNVFQLDIAVPDEVAVYEIDFGTSSSSGGGGAAPSVSTSTVTPTSGAAGTTFTSAWTGELGNPTATVTRQWELDGAPIIGATGETYESDAAGDLTCVVTFTNTYGTSALESAAATVTATPAFAYTLTVGSDGAGRYGYAASGSGFTAQGDIDPVPSIATHDMTYLLVLPNNPRVRCSFGGNNVGGDTLTVTFEGFGDVVLTWNAANSRYQMTSDPGLSGYLSGLINQDIGVNVVVSA